MSNYNFDKSKQCIGAMTIEIDFLQKKSTDSSPYDSDKMAAEFIQQFNNQAFSVTQQVCTLKTSRLTHTILALLLAHVSFIASFPKSYFGQLWYLIWLLFM